MSPMMEAMLLNEVVPRLRAAAPSIPKLGGEDDEEITQDATLMAARMMDSAEKAGRRFTGGNVAWYATRAARSGRRSYGTGRRDIYSPGCQLDGGARHQSLDDGTEPESGETCDLHDVFAPYAYAGNEPDPAEEAARNLDWAAFLASHPDRHRVALQALAEGGTMREAGRRCGLKDGAALLLKRRIAADLLVYFGEEVIRRLLDGSSPGWQSDMRTSRERHAARGGGERRQQERGA